MEKITNLKKIEDIKIEHKHVLFVSDIVYKMYDNQLNKISDKVIILNESEINDSLKDFSNIELIINHLIINNINRDDYVYCFGGGSLGDLIGFVSSIYKRGVNFINIPTTLLSMIDSSIGGKNAINYNELKNLIGTFYEAKEVFIIEEIINDFDKSIIDQGYGELVKYYFLDNMFDLEDSIFVSISKSIKYKQKIVKMDPHDENIRFCLNLGHSLGHVIESNMKITHGSSVIKGLYLESLVLNKMGYVSDSIFKLVNHVYKKYNNSFVNFSNIKWEDSLKHDKKVRNNMLKLPVIKNRGKIELIDIDINDIVKVLNELQIKEI